MSATLVENSPTVLSRVYVVDLENIGRAVSKVDGLNRKLAREGVVERFTYDYVRKDVSNADGTVESYYDFTLNRPVIRAIGGWLLVGKGEVVKTSDPASPVILTGYHIDDRDYRVESMWCGKCGTLRNRNRVFLLENVETGNIVQVGGECVRLYEGLAPNLGLLKTGDEIDEMMEGFAGKTTTAYDTGRVLSLALEISAGGRDFVPASQGRASTKERVLLMFKSADNSADLTEKWEADVARIREQGIEGDSAYAESVNALVKLDTVEEKHVGLVVSAVKTRTVIVKEERVLAKGYLGEVGGKLADIPVILTKRAAFENFYSPYGGVSFVYIFMTNNNEQLKWGSSVHLDADEGDELVLKSATVKAHTVYENTGDEQTVILRAKFLPKE